MTSLQDEIYMDLESMVVEVGSDSTCMTNIETYSMLDRLREKRLGS
jgi:hypothetical protein